MNGQYTKQCPTCGKLQSYTQICHLNRAIKNNLSCQSCCKIGTILSAETRNKLSELRKGKNNCRNGIRHTEESKHKMSVSKSGKNHPMYGVTGVNHHSFGRKLSDEYKEKISKSLRGRKHSLEHCRKIRLSTIDFISNCTLNGGQLFPRYNPTACSYFDNLSKLNGWSLQHAMNGGEHYLKSLGYWLDAYDKDKNIIVEYDEKWHGRKKEPLKI